MKINMFFFSFFILLFASTSQINAQNNHGTISLKDIRIKGIMTIGAYSQLIESQGYPDHIYISSINPISSKCLKEGDSLAPAIKIQCEYLVYDSYEYVRVGDSVQLVFIDLKKNNATIRMSNVVITPKITQKEFLMKMTKEGWWSEEQKQYKVGEIESHYYTHSKVKNFGIDFKEDPYSSVIFTFNNRTFDQRIWWIEFPIMRVGGIIH